MEINSNFKTHDHNNPPLNSPSTTSHHHHHHHNSNNGNSNIHHNHQQPPSLPITRSDPNSPYPTTFVTADTSSFKQVVQMLTGSSDSIHSPTPQAHETITSSSNTNTTTTTTSTIPNTTTSSWKGGYVIPPVKTTTPKKQGFKLYERRNSIKHLISPLTSSSSGVTLANHDYYSPTTSFSPRYKQEILSPSLLDFPSLTLSPVTPLVEDPFDKSSLSNNGPQTGPKKLSSEEEEEEEKKAIAEKGFFLHPSPVSTPRDSQPQLLPLFPLSSPRISQP